MRPSAPVCAVCQAPDHPAHLEYAPLSAAYCHRRCLLAALAAQPEGEALAFARELGLTRPAPGRPRFECALGHPFAGDNLLVFASPRGPLRYCRRCYYARQKEYRQTEKGQAIIQARQERTKRAAWQQASCKNGHAPTPENTLVGPHGNRRCRACQRLAGQKAAQARWGRPAGQQRASGPFPHPGANPAQNGRGRAS